MNLWERFLAYFKKADEMIRLHPLYTYGSPTNTGSSVVFGIYSVKGHKETKVGECDIRFGMNEELYYAGNVGYNVSPVYRGHHYAYYGCLSLFQIVKEAYGLDEIIITCSPDNIASKRTIERLGGQFLECVDVPKSHWLYKRGETVKNIYRIDL